MNNPTIEIIIAFLNAIKDGKTKTEQILFGKFCGKQYNVFSCKYLLGQMLRCLYLPKDHYFVSREAMKLWNSLTSEKIENYWYNKRIKCDKADNVSVKKYKSNSKNAEEFIISKNEYISFNKIFHEEHIVTISDIMNELLNLQIINEENVAKVLDKIYICKMLKEEDRNITERYKRNSTDYKEIINTVYKKHGIEVKLQ